MEYADALALADAVFGIREDELSWAQMCARAAIVFVFGVALVRIASKRVFGKWGALDIIVSVMIGSNLSRALTGSAPLVPTMAASLLLVFLHAGLSFVAARASFLGYFVKGEASRLVCDGAIDEKAMRRHGLGRRDLDEALRCAGVDDVSKVSSAWLERNGSISVVKR